MKKAFLSFLFSAVLLAVCTCSIQKKDQEKIKRVLKAAIFEEIAIPIDTVSLVYYPKNSSFVLSGTHYLAGYNQTRHTIDIFNLDKKSIEQHIALERQGPNEILKLYGLFVHNLDSIFVFDPSGLKLLNRKGRVHKLSYPRNDGTLIAASGSGIFYDNRSKSVLMYFQAAEFEVGRRKEGLSKPIVAEFHLETGKVDLLSVHYSKYIIENEGDFSSDIIPNLSFYSDRIICNFIVDSEICLYSREGILNGCFPGLSNSTENRLVPYSLDGMEIEQRILTGSMFQKVIYLENDKVYVRAHWGSQSLLTPEMKPATMISKPAFLMIFDEHFDTLVELPINRQKYFPDDYFATSDALYIWRDFTRVQSEDSLRLGRMRIEFIK